MVSTSVKLRASRRGHGGFLIEKKMGLSSRFGRRAYGTGGRCVFSPSGPQAIGCTQILLPGIGSGQHLAAFGGELRQRQPRFGRDWLRWRLWMDHLVLEPVGEIGRAAGLTLRWLGLALAGLAAGRASDADVEVIIVAVHRADLGEPAAIALGLAA